MKKNSRLVALVILLIVVSVLGTAGILFFVLNSNNTGTSGCTVTFDACGGNAVNSQKLSKGENANKPIPTRSGYDFLGWYLDSEYNEKFDFAMPINKNITLYAKWTNDESELYDFELTDDFAFYGITGYKGESTEITLPRLHNGLRVVSVNENAFKGDTKIEKVTLPNTIEYIYTAAFADCTNLENIVISTSVKTIFPMAFDGCTALHEIVLPNSVTAVGAMAFRHCDNLTEVTISTGMSEISNAMFQYCGKLKSLTLPANITAIGNSAVSYCYSLENLQILGDITLFGNSAFYDCQNLKSIYFASRTMGNLQSNSDNYIFYNAGIANNGITLTMAPNACLPIGVFMPYQNSNIPKITAVVFENGTTTIDSAEYNRMPQLASITVPDSVRNIAAGIFDNTPWYQTQPNGVIYIDNIVYAYKGSYTSNIVINDNVVAFGNNVFNEATGITNLTLPFVGRSRDASDVDRLFGALFSRGAYNGGVQIQQQYDTNRTVDFCLPQTLKNVTITDETTIPYGAFSGCTNLATIDLSQCTNLTRIESYALYGVEDLDRVIFPNQEIELAANAYADMPSSLIVIENLNSGNGDVQQVQTAMVINRVVTLTAVPNSNNYCAVWYDQDGNVSKIGNSVSIKTKMTLTLLKVDFKPVNYTVTFDSAGGNSIANLSVTLNEEFILPVPTRVGYDFVGWYYESNKVENGIYTFVTDVTLIAHWNAIFAVHNNGSSYAIELTDYGKQKNYTEIVIPKQIDGYNVNGIWYEAFSDCTNLISIVLPDSITSIGQFAFSGCTSLSSIIIPDSVISIGNGAFSGCTSLTSIMLPDGITSLGLDHVPIYECGVFSDCKSLTSIILSNSITSIGYWTFSGCTNLTSITIPDSVTSIEYGAFMNCSNLTTIYCEIDAQPEGWYSDWKSYCNAEVVWGYKG